MCSQLRNRYIFPSGHKTSLRHLGTALKFSYLDNTYIRRLQDNLTAISYKRAQKFLRDIDGDI